MSTKYNDVSKTTQEVILAHSKYVVMVCFISLYNT